MKKLRKSKKIKSSSSSNGGACRLWSLFVGLCAMGCFVGFLFSIPYRNKTLGLNDAENNLNVFTDTSVKEKRIISSMKAKHAANDCPVGWDLVGGLCERAVRSPSAVVTEMLDRTVNPCTDPYRYACGGYMDDERNAGENVLFFSLYQNNREIMQSIVLNQAIDFPKDDVGLFYRSCVNYLSLHESNDLEMSPAFQTSMQAVEMGLRSTKDLPVVMGVLARYAMPLPISLSMEIDPLNGSTLIPFISQHMGVFANTEDELASLEHMVYVQRRIPDLALAHRVVNLEKTLMGIRHESIAQTLHAYAGTEYNQTDLIRDWKAFSVIMKRQGFDIEAMVGMAWPIAGSLITRAWVYSPSYMLHFAAICNSVSVDVWRAYLKIVVYSMLDGSVRTDPEHHYAYHRSYDGRWGLPWNRPRNFYMVATELSNQTSVEQQCVYATEAYLPILLDEYYLHRQLGEDKLLAARFLVQNLTQTYIALLEVDQGDSFFSKHMPRQMAAKKLRNLQVVLGAPAHWKELLQFTDRPAVSANSFIENTLRIRRYHHQHVEKLFADSHYAPLDIDRLFDGLLSVDNAFYMHQLNAVVINAGLLQAPFFSKDYSLTSQYARLGVVVAHEISHALDRIGIHFDETGSVVSPPWMSVDAFREDAEPLIQLYTRRSYRQNWNDGEKTFNENLADQYGLHIAWKALKNIQPSASFAEFRLAYSQIYCDVVEKQTERIYSQKASHSINSVRVEAGLATFPCTVR
jgi:predicted metalloendopeptidase